MFKLVEKSILFLVLAFFIALGVWTPVITYQAFVNPYDPQEFSPVAGVSNDG